MFILWIIIILTIAFSIFIIMRVLSIFFGKSETYHINESVENKTKSQWIKKSRRSNEMDFDDWEN